MNIILGSRHITKDIPFIYKMMQLSFFEKSNDFKFNQSYIKK
jgi:hypothetical protein